MLWPGTVIYAPYRYHLKRFNTINTVSFDHPDPSIFTVLTSPTDNPGTANLDFVIFPERWMVAEDQFSATLVSSQCDERVYGLDRGRIRRQGEGFSQGVQVFITV
jgi:homogentisate 1,2-dioxygenase